MTASQPNLRAGRDKMNVDDIDGALPRRLVGVTYSLYSLNFLYSTLGQDLISYSRRNRPKKTSTTINNLKAMCLTPTVT